MKLFWEIIHGGGAAILALLLTSPHLADAKPNTTLKPAKCTHCSMSLSTKKTAATPIAVKVNGKTYYCCSGCGMSSPKSKPAKPTSGKTSKAKAAGVLATKTASIPLCPKCGMQMISSPTLLKKTPVVVNGKTYYCCTICPRH